MWRERTEVHKRRSSINFGGQDIFARKYMHEKLTKCPNFTWYLPEKLTKFSNFTGYMPEKNNNMPEFYMILPEKYFSRILEGSCPTDPPSPTPMLKCEVLISERGMIEFSKGFNFDWDHTAWADRTISGTDSNFIESAAQPPPLKRFSVFAPARCFQTTHCRCWSSHTRKWANIVFEMLQRYISDVLASSAK